MPKQRLSREESRRQTRDRLLTAAAQVFAQSGFNGASVEEIAEAAGYSKGAVYSNFDSKEDLFLALIDQYLEIEIEQLGHQLDLDLWQTQFDQELTDPAKLTINLLTVEFFLYAMRNPTAREKLAQRYRTAYAALEKLLAQHYHDRQMPMPSTQLALAMTAAGTGLFIQACIDPGGTPPGIYQQTLKRLLYGDSDDGSDDQNGGSQPV
jgi:AcrR family transcriptional regulator